MNDTSTLAAFARMGEMRWSRLVYSLGALAVAADLLPAQAVPSRALVKPDATVSEPFTYVGAVRELADGRLIVADRRDKIVQLVDMRTGSVSQIGREGSGPGEYGMPLALLPLPGDSTVVYDMVNSRFLTILPNGKPGATFRLEEAPAAARSPNDGGALAIASSRLGNPRASDARGRLYFEDRPFKVGPDGGPMPADSVAILRYDRTTKRVDTLAWLQMPKNAASVSSSGGANDRSVSMRVGSNTPFDSRDSWAVFPDGRLAIARLTDYHIDVIGPGKAKVSGPPNAFKPVRVGAAEKEEFRQTSQRTPSVSMSISDNNGSRQTSVSTTPPKFEEPKVWPATKPPFVNSGVFVRPNGEVWVQRHVSAVELPTFDIFNATGRLTQRVTLPKGNRLVGFGNGTVYTVRIDEDDLQYLQRFRG